MALPKINIDAVMKLPLSKKVGIVAGIDAVIVAVIYFLLIGPMHDEVTKHRAELRSLNEKLSENRQIAADIPKYLNEKAEMEDRLQKALAQLPNDKEIPDLIDSISRAGSISGLNILLFKPGREAPKGFYAEIPVNMSVEGRYESLYDFSVKIGNLPRIVNLGSMDITSAGYKNRMPSIKATFVATTFRFIPNAPAAKTDGKTAAAAQKN
jgi:type IV pilus assembly protein PilO